MYTYIHIIHKHVHNDTGADDGLFRRRRRSGQEGRRAREGPLQALAREASYLGAGCRHQHLQLKLCV